MKELITDEIRKVLTESEISEKDELLRLRTFHYNVHHIVFNPNEDMSPHRIIYAIKKLLADFNWG